MNISRALTAPKTIALLILASLALTACGGAVGDSWAGISVNPDHSAIYVAFNEQVVALNPTTGETVWKYPAKGDKGAKFYAVPAIDNGSLYVGDYKGRLHSVNLQTGESNWVYEPTTEDIIGPISLTPTDRVISGVAFDTDKVFFGLGSRNVVAVSRENADEIWTFKTGHGVWATPLYIPADPENSDSRAVLYVVSLDHHFYAINPDNGQELWSLDLGGAAPGNMLYDSQSNRVYVGTLVSELIAVDLNAHEIVDRYKTEGWLWGSPALDVRDDGTEVLYLGDLTGYLYAVEVTPDGFKELWKRRPSKSAIRMTPFLDGDLVIVGSKDKYVYALSKIDGTDRWDEKTKGEVLTEFVLVPADVRTDTESSSDLVVVGTEDKSERVVAYEVDTGSRVWRYSD